MTPDAQPTLVVVNGAPASGKTMLARHLSRELRIPLVAKDDIKERLYDTLGTGDREWSMRLGRAAFALLFAQTRELLGAGYPAILEAYMRPELSSPEVCELIEATGAHVVQVYLRVDRQTMIERYGARTGDGERHPGHIDDVILREMRSGAYCAFEPLDIPGETIEVDTTDFARVDYRALTARVRAAMQSAARGEAAG